MRLFLVMLIAMIGGGSPAQESSNAIQFRAVDISIDPQGQPLSAYQLEFNVTSGRARIVGIEGGAHPAFAEAPFHDPEAIQHERVIIAAFNTAPAASLPAEKTRVATIHLQILGTAPAQYSLKIETAGTIDGKKLQTIATFEERNTQ